MMVSSPAIVPKGVELRPFEEAGVKVKRGSIAAMDTGELANANGVFAGAQYGEDTVILLKSYLANENPYLNPI